MGTDFTPCHNYACEGTIKNYGARIPMQCGYRIRLPYDLSLSLATGPQLNINIFAKEHFAPDSGTDSKCTGDPLNLFNFGFHKADLQYSFIADLTYKKHYSIGVSGAIGLTDAASMSQGQRRLNIRRNNIAVVLIYKF